MEKKENDRDLPDWLFDTDRLSSRVTASESTLCNKPSYFQLEIVVQLQIISKLRLEKLLGLPQNWLRVIYSFGYWIMCKRTWWFLLIPAGTPDLRKRSDRRKTLLAGLVNVRSRVVGAVTSSSSSLIKTRQTQIQRKWKQIRNELNLVHIDAVRYIYR